MKRTALFLLISGWMIPFQLNAQSIGPSTFNSAGGSATVGGNTYEWSLGEMLLVSTLSSSGIIVSQGVLQPGPLPNRIGGIEIADGLVRVFPNPATTAVFVKTAMDRPGRLFLQLFDAMGKLVSQQQADQLTGAQKHEVNLAPFAAGHYMLLVKYVSTAGEAYRSFKIQKTQ
jgi:hypothetical protein